MISGYCWPQSARAGETVTLFVSTAASHYDLRVVRQGAEDEEVLHWAALPGIHHSVPDDVSTAGCGWPASGEITIEESWRSGCYLVRLIAEDGDEAHAFFVVRASVPGDALLVLATSTWAAYNHWGGHSFYTDIGQHVSSQMRPLANGFLERPAPEKYRVSRWPDLSAPDTSDFLARGYTPWAMCAGWSGWEHLFVRWAERAGFVLDYAVSHDLEEPDLLAPYQTYLSVGHDEYWSAGMRDTVEGFIDAGGRAAFFSGNTAFWQIRFESDQQRVLAYKNAITEDPVWGTSQEKLLTSMWSDPVVGRPENAMTGVSFTRGGYARMPNAPWGTGGYTVWRPDHWALEGTELGFGDQLGAEPIVVGYECDGCELALKDGLPVPTGADGTPPDFEVIATAPAHLWETSEATDGLGAGYIGELNWVAQRLGGADTPESRARYAHGAAVAGTFRRGQGEVFTSGCTDWAFGLSDPAVSRVTHNILTRFLAR